MSQFEPGHDEKRHQHTDRNLVRLGPDLMTAPQLARQNARGAFHVLTCLMYGKDPDSLPYGVDETNYKEGEPMDVPVKDRITCAKGLLDRGFGRAMDVTALLELEKKAGATIDGESMSIEQLEQYIASKIND